ncbi:tol-pal system-associated acyl-CoA thioesterase [Limnobacter sp.]|uniref:tol-pal system-associated acyl-CoA thioesterase n=1 Tax=Limnobacter sp. TaxID=2003368 RepID=UPI0025890140|nr:tol-pal system-associated acyl-CoA thioesterase [Limnobacter sp.]HEX5485012.1 tol-pal system-associated acyl-CoA thioesterase [Limnobacter sp.]
MAFKFPLRVYFEDTDAAGVVYYGNYLKFMERARSQWFLEQSIGMKRLMEEHKLVFVVSRTELNYRRSAKLEDALEISVEIAELKRASAVFRQEVWRQNELLCDGLTRVGCVNTETMRPAAIPASVMDELKKLL